MNGVVVLNNTFPEILIPILRFAYESSQLLRDLAYDALARTVCPRGVTSRVDVLNSTFFTEVFEDVRRHVRGVIRDEISRTSWNALQVIVKGIDDREGLVIFQWIAPDPLATKVDYYENR